MAAAGPGDGHDGNVVRQQDLQEVVGRVGDARRAGVGDQGNVPPLLQQAEQALRLGHLVVVVVAQQRAGDVEMGQQLAGVAGILGGDQVHAAKDAQGAQGDVVEIADGRGDDVQRAAIIRRRCFRHDSAALGERAALENGLHLVAVHVRRPVDDQRR